MGVILGIITGASLLASALVAVWMVGAIFFDLSGGAKWGRWVALAWVAGVVAMLVAWRPLWQPVVALLGAESLFLAWWFRLTALEVRRAALGGGVDALLDVFGPRAQLLGGDLELQRRRQRRAGGGVDQPLRQPDRDRRAGQQLAHQLVGRGVDVGGHAVGEAEALGGRRRR